MRRHPDPSDEQSWSDAVAVPAGAEDVAVYDSDLGMSEARDLRVEVSRLQRQAQANKEMLEYRKAEVAVAVKHITALLAALEAVEWIPRENQLPEGRHVGDPWCPECRSFKALGHAPDCQLAAALRAAKGE